MEEQKDLINEKKPEKIFNPIGFLNEFCQKTKTASPMYVIKNREGPDHSPTFNIECIFNNLTFYGNGLTIKEAKENSAFNAIENLNLKKIIDKENKQPSFRIVEVGSYFKNAPPIDLNNEPKNAIEYIWDGICPDMKITFIRKDGSLQQFKTFIFTKVKELEKENEEE